MAHERGAAPAPRVEQLLSRQILLQKPPPPGRRRRLLTITASLLAIVLVVLACGTGFHYEPPPPARFAAPGDLPQDAAGLDRYIARQQRRWKSLDARLNRLAPRGVYIVVDQTQNRLYLKRGNEILLDARCSAGSGMVLQEGEGGKNRRWVFDTPRGLFRVRRRVANPVWSKPDWAFVEEGKPIPKNPAERIEYGTLGEYALYLGDGYLIHGTLYERLLGRSVTHGCIRLGRDDLRRIWAETRVGTPVYIY